MARGAVPLASTRTHGVPGAIPFDDYYHTFPSNSQFALDQTTVRSGIWQVLRQDAVGIDVPSGVAEDESDPPRYEPTDRSRSPPSVPSAVPLANSTLHRDRSLARAPMATALLSRPSSSTLRHSRSFLQIEPQDFTYTYNLLAGKAQVQIFILVEAEVDRASYYTLSLSMKVGDVERAVSNPVTLRLAIDPRALDFVVFAFPPRSGLPSGCLYNLRVWLRTPAADHRLFGEKDLWFGRDPNFSSITDASFASLRNSSHTMSIYQGLVGRARVTFIIRHKHVESGIYALSLEYEAGGVGRTLFENYYLRFYCEPHAVSYMIYTIPVTSTPSGASHRLRVWVRTPHRLPTQITTSSSSASSSSASLHSRTLSENYLYQRLWKSDDFKIGAQLRFEAIGNSIALATRAQGDLGPAYESMVDSASRLPRLTPNRRRVSRLTPNVSAEDGEESVNDR